MAEMWAVDRLRADPRNRAIFDPMDGSQFEELVKSVREMGVLQPILAMPDGLIIAGEQRWRAAKVAGLGTVPVEVKEPVDDDEMTLMRITENVERRSLKPPELYRALKERERIEGRRTQGREKPATLRVSPPTDAEIARGLGIHERTITTYRKLDSLHPDLLSLFVSGELTLAVSYQLAHLSAADQRYIIEKFRDDEIKELKPVDVKTLREEAERLGFDMAALVDKFRVEATDPLEEEIRLLKARIDQIREEAARQARDEYREELAEQQRRAAEEQGRRAKKTFDELAAEVPGADLARLRLSFLKALIPARELLVFEPAYVARVLLPDELEALDGYFGAFDKWRERMHKERSRGLVLVARAGEG